MKLLALGALLVLFPSQAPRIEDEELPSLHAAIVPREQEVWQTIPWRTDLLEARDDAAREKKPLFLWTMNGHPLGCT